MPQRMNSIYLFTFYSNKLFSFKKHHPVRCRALKATLQPSRTNTTTQILDQNWQNIGFRLKYMN